MKPSEMDAGPELDAYMLEHVMHWPFARPHWNPSEDIHDAWDVVEKFRKHRGTDYDEPGGYFCLEDHSIGKEEWWCSFLSPNLDGALDVDKEVGRARTAPLAICRAALLAVGVE